MTFPEHAISSEVDFSLITLELLKHQHISDLPGGVIKSQITGPSLQNMIQQVWPRPENFHF